MSRPPRSTLRVGLLAAGLTAGMTFVPVLSSTAAEGTFDPSSCVPAAADAQSAAPSDFCWTLGAPLGAAQATEEPEAPAVDGESELPIVPDLPVDTDLGDGEGETPPPVEEPQEEQPTEEPLPGDLPDDEAAEEVPDAGAGGAPAEEAPQVESGAAAGDGPTREASGGDGGAASTPSSPRIDLRPPSTSTRTQETAPRTPAAPARSNDDAPAQADSPSEQPEAAAPGTAEEAVPATPAASADQDSDQAAERASAVSAELDRQESTGWLLAVGLAFALGLMTYGMLSERRRGRRIG